MSKCFYIKGIKHLNMKVFLSKEIIIDLLLMFGKDFNSIKIYSILISAGEEEEEEERR